MPPSAAQIFPFRIEVADEEIDDLLSRLARTRWAGDFANDGGQFGMPAARLRALVAYWLNGFDWRASEAELNALPHFRIELGGLPIHFIWIRSGRPEAVPLVLTHGWPWTFWDFNRLVPLLAGTFDLVVPSLPGFAFSTPLRRPGVGAPETADLWAELMSALGYARFGAVGSDWGAHVAANLAHAHADRLIGAYLTTCAIPGCRPPVAADFAENERADYERSRQRMRSARAHVLVNRDTPQTAAWALNDSPAGLLAMLVEKRLLWMGTDRDLEEVFPADFLLTTAAIYWFTGSTHSAARFYASSLRGAWTPRHARSPRLEAPIALGIFPDEPFLLPRATVEAHANLVRWQRFPRGGHYAPMEEPGPLAADINAFFHELTR